MDWNAVTSFTTIGAGTGISIGGNPAASSINDSGAPSEGDDIAIAFTDPAFPTLEATLVSTNGGSDLVVELAIDQTRWHLTRTDDDEFGSAKKATGNASEWIVRDTA